jgi:coproporphyrinogen III oxidase-like Fe-S oxidoreductase
MDASEPLAFLEPASERIDIQAIVQAWQQAAPQYDVDQWKLPLPLWTQRPYDHSGSRAWQNLQADLAYASAAPPLCIYMHIPFCSRKCGFCDSYSFKLGAQQDRHIQTYVDAICSELDTWAALGSLPNRPVPTVHLGGGTPTFLGETALLRLVEHCRKTFGVSSSTEWALESNVKHLASPMLETLHGLGFRRLHIGVQSLQDEVRLAIGRQSTASQVLDTIEKTLRLGWVVSVDLICGLPGQTLVGFLDGIDTLLQAGIDGYSIYELLIYPQNYQWAKRYALLERRHLPNYLMFQAGAALLEQHGFEKNLFNHWANARDANIYFTFPTRGEDLLAIGTIADGVFGDYHYRHPRYAPYLQASRPGDPGLEGGLRRTPLEGQSHRLSTALLSGHLSASDVATLSQLTTDDGFPLPAYWQSKGMLLPEANGVRLTNNGSWFAGNLIAEINTALATPV